MTNEQLKKIIDLDRQRNEKKNLLNTINSGIMVEFWGTKRSLKSITSDLEEEIAEINSELNGMKIIESNNKEGKSE